MRIAVTTENKKVFQHFEKCQMFTMFDVVNGKLKGVTHIDTSASGSELLTEILINENVDVLLCGTLEMQAEKELMDMKIEVIKGLKGPIDMNVKKYLQSKKR